MNSDVLLLGVDGGGTNCRARLCAFSGEVLGEAATGPANLRLGLGRSFSAVSEAATQCLDQAGLGHRNLARVVACLALAGAGEPAHLAAARAHKHPFCETLITTDAHAACIGAHGNRDGAVIVAGTGTIGWAVLKGQSYRVGGWGLPISDEGSGAWLGCVGDDPHAIVRWTQTATPRDFGLFAPRVFDHAGRGDPVAGELMDLAAGHIDALASRLISAGATQLALVGGCAPFLKPRLRALARSRLVEPAGDALQGAVYLARSAAQLLARVA